MEESLRNLISKHFRDRESRLPDIAFEECFPGADPMPLLWTGRVFAAAIAASLLVAVLIAGKTLLTSPQSAMNGNILAENLARDLEQNDLLALDANQAVQIDHLLASYFSARQDPLPGSMEQARGDLFRAVLADAGLALNADQARAAAGLMSSWEPRIENGVITSYDWSQDKPLEQFLAGCAAYCHQGTPQAEVLDYLSECVMQGFAIPCSPVQTGLPGARREIALPN